MRYRAMVIPHSLGMDFFTAPKKQYKTRGALPCRASPLLGCKNSYFAFTLSPI